MAPALHVIPLGTETSFEAHILRIIRGQHHLKRRFNSLTNSQAFSVGPKDLKTTYKLYGLWDLMIWLMVTYVVFNQDNDHLLTTYSTMRIMPGLGYVVNKHGYFFDPVVGNPSFNGRTSA